MINLSGIIICWYCFIFRKKIIGLDDLLSEFHHEVNPVNEAKKKSKTKHSNSDDEDCAMKSKEELLSKFVSECQKQACKGRSLCVEIQK